MKWLKNFVHKHPARVAAWVSSTVAIVATAVGTDIPLTVLTTFVLSSLGLGEFAQRVENGKTETALWTDPLNGEG